MDPATIALIVALTTAAIVEELKKHYSVQYKEIDKIYQTVLNIQENLRSFIGTDKYKDNEFPYPQSVFEKIIEFYAKTPPNYSPDSGIGVPNLGPIFEYQYEYREGREAGKGYYKEHEGEFENKAISDIFKDIEKSRDKDVSDAYLDGYKEGIKEAKEETTSEPGQRDKSFFELLKEAAEAYNESQVHPYYPGREFRTEEGEGSRGSDDIQKALQTYKELSDKLSNKDYSGAMVSLTSFVEQVNEMNKSAPAGTGLAEVVAAVGQLAEIGGRMLPALAILHGKSPQEVAAKLLSEKGTREPERGDIQDVLAAVAVLQETVNGLSAAIPQAAKNGSEQPEKVSTRGPDSSVAPVIGEMAKIKEILINELMKNATATTETRNAVATVDERVKNIAALLDEHARKMFRQNYESSWTKPTDMADTRDRHNITIRGLKNYR